MRKRRTILVITLILACLLTIALFVGVAVNTVRKWSNVPAHTKQELLTELDELRPPRDAIAVDESEIVKPNLVLVGKQYSRNSTYESLRKHYDAELSAKGWVFVDERKVTDWGRDYGQREAHYCKQGMSAALFYNGNRASQTGFVYALELSSGLDDCK